MPRWMLWSISDRILSVQRKDCELLDSENEIALSSATEILNRVTKNDNMRSSVI